jgi:hypothetical protein
VVGLLRNLGFVSGNSQNSSAPIDYLAFEERVAKGPATGRWEQDFPARMLNSIEEMLGICSASSFGALLMGAPSTSAFSAQECLEIKKLGLFAGLDAPYLLTNACGALPSQGQQHS